MQLLEMDFDKCIKVVGSGCMKCEKVWVLDRENLKNHPGSEDIYQVEASGGWESLEDA